MKSHGGARALLVVELAAAIAIAGCRPKKKTGPTEDWFTRHRSQFVAVRAMIAEDRGHVVAVQNGPIGGLRSASGASGSCSSPLRGGEFPWRCAWTSEPGKEQVVQDLSAAERLLGIPEGRLREYERAMPSKSIAVGGRCLPAGSITFWLTDSDSAPCVGMRNIVWSPTPPAIDDKACPTTVVTTYKSYGDGFYEHACSMLDGHH